MTGATCKILFSACQADLLPSDSGVFFGLTLSKLGKLHILRCFNPHTNPSIVSTEWNAMTMDQSLKVKAGAIKTRNVLTRAERIAQLKKLDRFDEEASVVGMAKTRVMKVSLKRKKKVKKAEDDDKKK